MWIFKASASRPLHLQVTSYKFVLSQVGHLSTNSSLIHILNPTLVLFGTAVNRREIPPHLCRRRSGRTRSRGSPACTGHAECTRRRPRRISRTRASACRPSCDTSNCPLSAISCRPCSAAVARNSCLRLVLKRIRTNLCKKNPTNKMANAATSRDHYVAR